MADASESQTAADNQQTTAALIDLPSLVREQHAAVYRYAYRLCGCQAEAEDLTQQTFLIAHQRLSQLRDPARAKAWLLAVVRSCFLKSLRRSRPAPAQDFDLNVNEIADRTPAMNQVDRGELHTALADLPDDFRVVLLMFYFEELSYQEIAAELEVPLGTVMSRLSRAKGHLRNKLSPPAPEPARPALARPPAASTVFATTAPVRAAR